MKKRFLVIKKNRNLFSILIILALIICSLSVIIVNGLLFNSEFQESIRISFADDSEIYGEFEKVSNISFIDRGTKEIYIENTSFEKVIEEINRITEGNAEISTDDYEIEEISAKASLESAAVSLAFVNMITIISIPILVFYYQSIRFKKVSLKPFIRFVVNFSLTILISTIVSFGFISLLSRIYRIKVIEVEMLAVISILTVLISVLASEGDFTNINSKIADFIKTRLSKIYGLFFISSLFLPLGLSGAIVIPVISILVFILITLTIFHSVSTIEVSWLSNKIKKSKVVNKGAKISKKPKRSFSRRNRKKSKK